MKRKMKAEGKGLEETKQLNIRSGREAANFKIDGWESCEEKPEKEEERPWERKNYYVEEDEKKINEDGGM